MCPPCARAGAQRVLVIGDANTLIGRQVCVWFRVRSLFRDLLVGLAALTGRRLKVFVFCHAALLLKLSLEKMSGWLDSLASVNTIAMRVVSAATTNGPRSFRKLSTSNSAAFCSLDLSCSLGTTDILSRRADVDRCLIVLTHRRPSKLYINRDQPRAPLDSLFRRFSVEVFVVGLRVAGLRQAHSTQPRSLS